MFVFGFLSAQTNISVDCSAGTLDFNYCYPNNDTNVITFTTTTGFPVTITFNAGTVEDGWDEFIVYDSDGTELTPANYYGNSGDLTGLTYTSTGTSLQILVNSDGSISCDSGSQTAINATVMCQTCVAPTVVYSAIGDCSLNPDAPEFIIEANITDFGSVSSVQVTDDQGSPGQLPTGPGVLTFGPYPAGTNVILEVSTDDINCINYSDALTVICAAPPNECSMIYAGPDQTFDCTNNTIILDADFQVTGQDFNVYEINGLGGCPTPPVSGGTPTSLEIDDRWSDAVDMGFDFCFFGDVYNQLIVGANGGVSFDISNAGNSSGWSFSQQIPNSTNPTLSTVNIFAGYHDINPQTCGDINYSVLGSAPSRQFVINYNEVCQFSCSTQKATMQVILYESSNNIDINVFEKPACTWNGGNAVIGVQNMAADIAFAPAGRNTGSWSIDPSAPESYRFSPGQSATPDYVFEWYQDGIFIGNTETITVNPTDVSTTYVASVTYTQCAGPNVTITDSVTVELMGTISDTNFTLNPTCEGATTTITGDLGGVFAFNPIPTDGAQINAATGEVTTGVSGETYTVEYAIDPTGICGSTTSVTFTVLNAIVLNQQNLDLEVCTSNPSGFSTVDLTQFNSDFTLGITNSSVDFYNSENDAINNINTLSSVTAYQGSLNETIYVRVEDLDSRCFDVATIDIKPGTNCVFPQGISPNNDGLNDRFDLTSYDVMSLEVFNRNGRKVYVKSNGYTNEWFGQTSDGEELPTGTYYYIMKNRGNEVKASYVYINR